MEQGKKKKDAKEQAFKRLFGVDGETFEEMKSILQKKYGQRHKRGGGPPKLSIQDKLTITLKYHRECRAMESIGADCRVSKSTVCETIQWVEDALSKHKTFKLPGKKVLAGTPQEIQRIAVDVTESPIQRPQKPNSVLFGEKEASYHKNTGRHQPEEPADSGHTAGEGERPRFQTV